MSVEGQIFYPGEQATAREVLLLAHEYRRAADALLPLGRRGDPVSRAPYRFVAIHAVELYLNALLLSAGFPPARLRGLQHDLVSRTELATDPRFKLRKRTVTHLQGLSQAREYLTTRYDPAAATSELNRLAATLAEIAGKITALLDRHCV